MRARLESAQTESASHASRSEGRRPHPASRRNSGSDLAAELGVPSLPARPPWPERAATAQRMGGSASADARPPADGAASSLAGGR